MIDFDICDRFIKQKKQKRTYNESKGDFSFLSSEEIQLINELIEDDIFANYQISDYDTNIKSLKEYKKDRIYIYHNKKNNRNIYIIKNKYYCIEKGRLKNIKKKLMDRKGIYESKMLTKIANNKLSSNPTLRKA